MVYYERLKRAACRVSHVLTRLSSLPSSTSQQNVSQYDSIVVELIMG